MRHRNRDPANAPNRYKVKSLRSEMVYEKGLRWVEHIPCGFFGSIVRSRAFDRIAAPRSE